MVLFINFPKNIGTKLSMECKTLLFLNLLTTVLPLNVLAFGSHIGASLPTGTEGSKNATEHVGFSADSTGIESAESTGPKYGSGSSKVDTSVRNARMVPAQWTWHDDDMCLQDPTSTGGSCSFG